MTGASEIGGRGVEFRLLGPIEVVDDGRPVDLGPRKQRALLCLLALHANRVVTTDRILEDLWGDEAAGKENALWVAISRLRSALEQERDGRRQRDVLQTRDHGYLLQVDPESIDLLRFEAAVVETRRLIQRDAQQAAERADAALALWRGAPMEEFQHEEFARLEVSRLDELRLEALELRAEAQVRLGRGREQIGALEALHAQHPLREGVVELLMRSLYQAGRHADALRAFDRYRRSIGDELGITPAPELRRLEERILLHDPTLTAANVEAPGVTETAAVNPFKGLRPFGEDDAAVFFGRERLVSDVIRRIDAGQRLVALVGISGSGKSSVVGAGVLPAIRKGAIDGSERWLVAQMTPGSRPMLELEAALLRSTFDPPSSLSEQLATPEVGLLRAALRLLPTGSRLLLVIDQFEELFALVDNEAERAEFLTLLGPSLDDAHGRVVVILTLRADFYDRPLMYPTFAERLGDGIVNVAALTPDELESAVHEPLREANVAIEPGLLAALLADVIGRPGVLPLFQYTLTMLFDRRQDGVVTLDAYREMGGLQGALARRAEDLWTQLDDAESAAARQLFLRLVTITGDRDWSRRRVSAAELTSLRRNLIAMQRVIEMFGAHRLLAFDRDPLTGSPTVEVAHEALLTAWPRLRGWIDEAQDDVVRHAALVVTMSEWQRAGCSAGYVLAGQRLADHEAWIERTTLDLSEEESDFVARSIAVRDDADRGEAERTSRELALARRVRRRSLSLVAVVLLVAVGSTAVWVLTRSPDVERIAFVRSPYIDSAMQQQTDSGWDQAQREHDFDAVTLTPVSDPAAEIDALADSGFDLIVIQQDLVGEVPAVATAHPDIRFLSFDNPGHDVGLPNVTVAFASDVAAGTFLAGAAAALTSETGTIGYLGGHPMINDPFRAGYEAGARAIDPDIEIVSTYLVQSGSFDVFMRPQDGAPLAADLYRAGADVVFHAAGASGDLVPKIADELSDRLGRHLWVIGVDTDQWLQVDASQREHVLTSLLKRHDLEFEIVLDRYFAGELEAGTVALGLADGIYALSTSGDHLSAASRARIDGLAADLTRRAINVSDVPIDAPTMLPAADQTVRIEARASECLVEHDRPLVAGTVRVELQNSTGGSARIRLIGGELPLDADPDDAWVSLGLAAAPGGANAGILRMSEGPWTLVCDGTELRPIRQPFVIGAGQT